MSNKTFSYEFFPPKTEAGEIKLRAVWEELQKWNAEFFSVTYGAGGSTRDKTYSTVMHLNNAGLAVAPHVSFAGNEPDEVMGLLEEYRGMGINRLVALRGDLPSGMGYGQLIHANEVVAMIREKTGDHFHIEVAAYPEMHPQAENLDRDIAYLKKKFEAGANSAITQYFYNADAYFHLIERCAAIGIDQPIIPGIMPITNYNNLARFSDACGAEIPRWIRKTLEACGDDTAAILELGTQVVTQLCERLLEGGAPGLHFYTMNRSEPVVTICKNLGIKPDV